jgi:lysyl-tRNA synthetase class 2
MREGMPACAGVALGVDRLFMLSQNLDSIDDAIAFPFTRA